MTLTEKNIKMPESPYEGTMVEAIENGKADGYNTPLEYKSGKMYGQEKAYRAQELRVDLIKRFEGMSNPADNSIYFRISGDDGMKVYFTSPYGIGANEDALSFLIDAEGYVP